MPRPVSRPGEKATKKATKSKQPTKKKNNVKAREKAPQPEATESIVTNPIDRIYKTFTLGNDDFEDGLWMMRKLGNGKYEAVNLSTVSHEDISSPENEARLTSVPENLEIFKASQKSLNAVTEKLDRAVFTGSGKVFRFNKLPIELRYKIYELALISPSGRALYRPRYKVNISTTITIGLLATSRTINEECVKFFWKNTFALTAFSLKDLKLYKKALVENARHIKCSWTGYKQHDSIIFSAIPSFEKLESLEIVLTWGCVRDRPSMPRRAIPQFLHQDDDSIRKFSKTLGFDKLISLRGIKKVIVSRESNFSIHAPQVSETEIKVFEKFLIKKLTTAIPPISPPVVLTPPSSTPTRKSTRIQKLKGVKPIKYVPDPVSDDEEDL